MLPHPMEERADASRERVYWAVLAVLCGGQLLAFWMLCSHQVRKAQMRDLTLQVQRVAVADCLQYIPRATLNSCASRVDPYSQAAKAVAAAGEKAAAAMARTTMSSTLPVGVAYH